ncbi:kinase-like domain-containing protein [Trametes polyzona]|nr:kinase-like domain-containing protein [Trametes polyzona]
MRGVIPDATDSNGGPTGEPSTDRDEAQRDIQRILSSADVCVLIGAMTMSAALKDCLRDLRFNGGTIVAVDNVDHNYHADVAFRLRGPCEEIVSQIFAIGPNSRVLEDGSVRTYFPGISITSKGHSRHIAYAGITPLPDNTIPLCSKSYVDLRPPLISRPPMSKVELLALTDEDIVRLCKTSPSLTDTRLCRALLLVNPIYLLASNVVVKVGSACHLRESEAKAQALVREQTTIPVPEVHRFFEHEGTAYFVMEYVKGDTLDLCWNDLSNWQKLRIAFTLRNYVRQMRRICTPQTLQQAPGPITADPSHPLPCSTPSLGEYPVRSFTSQEDMRDWMNGRFRVSEYLYGERIEVPLFDDSAPLVFTHGDLCLRNIILGSDGRLWLIDFGSAGIYPPWFEAFGARDNEMFAIPKLWTAARKIAVGEYDVQERYARICQHAFSHGLGIPDPGEGWDPSSGDYF